MVVWNIKTLAETGSTNDEAKRLAEQGAGEGLVIWALRQTAGRGRRGRAWQSQEGNLACSLLLRPLGGQDTYGAYSFVSALAVYDAVAEALPLRKHVITLKWPNDVLVGGKKICGILLETGQDWVVAGIGLNVVFHPVEATYPATSMVAEGMEPQPLQTQLERLLNCYSRWGDIMAREGFSPIRAGWLQRAQRGGMTVKLSESETVKGEFIDMDEHGSLRLKLEDGRERTLTTGDVSF